MEAAELGVSLNPDHTAEVEIRRGPNNFFDIDLIEALADTFERLESEGCRAIVLCSEGRHFCAGADFSGSPTTRAPGAPHLYEAATRLFDGKVPIIAAVQGAAIGGGLGLALVADFRIAAPEARFAANFARLGFHHGFGLTATLPPVIGQQATLDLLYTGRRVNGAEAAAIGLCDELVALDEVRPAAQARAATIAASAPLAVASIRETMRGPLAAAVRVAVARERAEQERLMTTDDWREGVAATADRRDPVFMGR
ncbi:MAG: enoyl-CoA hydratase/isomerase family protein [Desertimonas sp.]